MEELSEKQMENLEQKTGLSKDHLAAISKAGIESEVSKGEVLIEEGDSDEIVYLLLEGGFDVYKKFDGEPRKMAALEPGQWIGEIAFVREVPRTSRVIANSPSRVVALNKKTFKELDSELQLTLIRIFSNLASVRIAYLINREQEFLDRREELLNYISSIQNAERATYSRSHMIQTIVSNIPRLPMYAGEFIHKLQDPDVSFKEISDKIKEDPSLAAQILKFVNSPYYGFEQKIWDLQHAIMLLGFNQVYQLVLFNALRKTMPDTKQFRDLQAHSVYISYLAAELAAKTKPDMVAYASTLGLLHDIGRSVMYLLSEEFPRMDVVFETLEPAILGSMLLESWNIPAELCDGMLYPYFLKFQGSEVMPKQSLHSAAIMSLAHLALDYLLGKDVAMDLDPFLEDFLSDHGLTARSTQELVDENIVPSLSRKKKAIPAAIRELIQGNINNAKEDTASESLFVTDGS